MLFDYHIPIAPSVEYVYSTFDQKFDFKIRRDHPKKKSYEGRVYESVDVRSPFWVIAHKSTESSTQDSMGYKNRTFFEI